MKVLLVNDDQVIMDRTAIMLEDLGCEVYVAMTEEQAADSCKSFQPETVIIDIEMQGGRGFESISAVRRLNGSRFLVAVTRGDHKEIWPHVAEACGATEYVTGPVSAGKLMELIAPRKNIM